jgi:hypothetical protein
VKGTVVMAKVMVEKPILMIMIVKGMVVMAKVMGMQPILMIVHSEGNGCDG